MSGVAQTPGWPRLERTTDGMEYRIRPMRADDAAREREFILSLSPESRFQRSNLPLYAAWSRFSAPLPAASITTTPRSVAALIAS